MPPIVDESTVGLQEDDFRRAKVFTRYIIHVIHFMEALILLYVFPLDIVTGHWNPFLLYLAPLIILLFIIETPHLFLRTAPQYITTRLGIFNTLRGRGFVYQAASALIYLDGLCSGLTITVTGAYAWFVGLLLYLLGSLAHEFGLEDWVEEHIKQDIRLEDALPEEGDTMPSLEPSTSIPPDQFPRFKIFTRYIMHITHLLVVVLLFAAVVMDLSGLDGNLLVFYIVPFIIIVLLIEICHLFLRIPPERLTSPLGVFNTLWGRAFMYQAAAAVLITHGHYAVCDRPGWVKGWSFIHELELVKVLGLVAWGEGVALLLLAIIARTFKFEDWLVDPVQQGIRLEETVPEDLVAQPA